MLVQNGIGRSFIRSQANRLPVIFNDETGRIRHTTSGARSEPRERYEHGLQRSAIEEKGSGLTKVCTPYKEILAVRCVEYLTQFCLRNEFDVPGVHYTVEYRLVGGAGAGL
jgi:hypothetical protein